MRKHDLTGKIFGKLTVAKLSKNKKNGSFLWECICECGNTAYAGAQILMVGRKKSCGCLKLNLIGFVTGNLTVIEEGGIKTYDDEHSERLWLCKCSCGQNKKYSTAVLTKNKVKTCGCSLSRVGNWNPHWKGHGEISACMWRRIKSCGTSRNLDFEITIEQIWNLFLTQNRQCALSKLLIGFGNNSQKIKSKTSASLDRIDSSKGYILENVQWIHKDINRMKTDFSQDYFLSLCKLIANVKDKSTYN